MSQQAATKALLQWHLDAGVDEAIADTPQDRFAQHAAEQSAKAARAATGPSLADAASNAVPKQTRNASMGTAAFNRAPVTKPQSPAMVSDRAALDSATELSGKAKTLNELRAALEQFEGCSLKTTATNMCFIDGNPKARVLLVGEAPGAEEDRRGLPFVGPSGQLLDAMLASIGLDRQAEDADAAALISNTVFWRPPGNRTPTPQEAALCQPFIERLVEIVAPKVLVCVGGPSAKSLLVQTQGITRLRGKWFDYATARMDNPIPAMALYHPAYLLRSPAMKRDAWKDLLMLKANLAEPA